MSTHDADGKPYARLDQLQPGHKVICDSGFDCLPPYGARTIWSEPYTGRLYIECKRGKHFLEGQLADDSDALIGLYLCEPLA